MALPLNSSNSSIEGNPSGDILTAEQAAIFLVVNIVMVCSVISFLGIIGNTINFVVFLKQGFQNTISICFFGLVISDTCCLVTLMWTATCFNPLVILSRPPWVPMDFVYLTGAWPHHIFARITSYVTVYITAERCACIVFPLKVKQIMTPGKTAVSVCLIYVLNIIILCPEYVTSYLDWTFFLEDNATLLAIVHRKGRKQPSGLIFFLNSITGTVSFASVIVLTAILAVKLKKASIWRSQAKSVSSHADTMSSRDQKTVKMVTLIATVLIVCLTPGVVASMVTFVEPEFDLKKKYVNTAASLWTFVVVGQAVNSSINIVLYYKISSKYRQTYHVVLGTCSPRYIQEYM